MILTFYFFVLLILALSTDAFVAGLSYGIEKVKVPFPSLFITALLSGSMLTLSMAAGNFLIDWIPPRLTKALSFLVLFLLSLYKFYDARSQARPKENALTTGSISKKVNRKDPDILSCREAALLALALSIDNVSAGLCTGTTSLPPALLLLLTTAIHLFAIKMGLSAGHFLSRKSSHNFAWLGAAILMLLSFFRLF